MSSDSNAPSVSVLAAGKGNAVTQNPPNSAASPSADPMTTVATPKGTAIVQLLLTVEFDLNGELPADLAKEMEANFERAIGSGALSGQTAAEVVTHELTVVVTQVVEGSPAALENDLSKEGFLALQQEAEGLEMAHAQGQDLPEHVLRLQVIDKLMKNGPWTLHSDYGCVLKADVNRFDRAAG